MTFEAAFRPSFSEIRLTGNVTALLKNKENVKMKIIQTFQWLVQRFVMGRGRVS